jgi:protein tyrosine phosphatase
MEKSNHHHGSKSPFPDVTDLRKHWDYLRSDNSEKKYKKNYEVEYEYIEDATQSLTKDWSNCFSSALKRENNNKNRYPDVLPLETTRVKLDGGDCSDYINANFISDVEGNRKYITTQGPTEPTIIDFWRMIWIHKVNVIVMLTKEVENGVNKSYRYWSRSDSPNSTQTFGQFEITLKSKESDDVARDDIITRIFLLKNSREKESEPREIYHFQYTGWPDHGSPGHSQDFLRLMNLVDNAVVKNELDKNGGLICIHCSAGIGRTGTFCTIHLTIHAMRKHFKAHGKAPPISVVNTVFHLRYQRHGMVQTKDQYLFCYQIIKDEFIRLENEQNQKNSFQKNNMEKKD